MARVPRQLNPEILRDRLPENYRVVLDQAETNVNRAVGEIIQGYEQNLAALAKQLEEGKFSEEFQREIIGISSSFEAQVADLVSCIEEIRSVATKLEANEKPSAQSLAKLAAALSAESSTLENRLKETREKVKKLGETSGKVLATALRKMVTGGI